MGGWSTEAKGINRGALVDLNRFDIDGCSLEFDFEVIFKRYQER